LNSAYLSAVPKSCMFLLRSLKPSGGGTLPAGRFVLRLKEISGVYEEALSVMIQGKTGY
jgi:hypothetical protein